ncbi:MAG: YiiD C-terminal domain-containing protein [Stagnimonas sp.]|nr:YiiD C-terminal domain-containing protein [Stagnimonas sp.]
MTDAPAPFAPARKLLEQGIAFVQRSGLTVDRLERGRVVCRMPFAGNGNHIGTMYAGALFTLAEIPGGALFLTSFDSSRFYPVVKALNLKFLRPVKGDVTVEAVLDEARISAIEAEAAAQGKAEFTLNLDLRDGSGTVVASSEGIYQIRKIS